MMNNTHGPRKRAAFTLTTILLVFYGAFIGANVCRAQWTTSGSNTTTSNNVGVGISSPTSALEVQATDSPLTLSQAGIAGKSVLQSASGTDLHLTANGKWSGNIWNRFDTSIPSWNIFLSPTADYMGVRRSAAASGTISWSDFFIIRNSGNVGVGTSTPLAKFQVVTPSYTDTPVYGWDNHFFVVGADASAGAVSLSYNQSTNTGYLMSLSPSVAWRNTVINPFGGNVGIGLTNPGARLEVDANAITNTGIRVKNTYSADVFAGIEYSDNSGNVKAFNGLQPSTGEFRVNNVAAGGYINFMINSSSKMQVANNGNVGVGKSPAADIRLDVEGNLNATGTITGNNIIAKYQDVAEWVPTSQKLSAGTVVILDPEKSNQVLASKESYDTRVAGVVSERPGIALGEAGENKVLVATTGRVRVRVDASSGPIRVGDLLVASDKEGVAMKSQPVNVGGVLIHRPGTIIGKALEPWQGGTGEILVLLSLQ